MTASRPEASFLSSSGSNASITAQGAGPDSNIVVQCSDVKAGRNGALRADNAVQLQAAQAPTNNIATTRAYPARPASRSVQVACCAIPGLSGSKRYWDGHDVTQTITTLQAPTQSVQSFHGKWVWATISNLVATVQGEMKWNR